MIGKISLKDFIHQVRDELIEAQTVNGRAFYALDKVELEVSFALEANADGKAKLVVLELGGSTTATQTHKVKLILSPLETEEKPRFR